MKFAEDNDQGELQKVNLIATRIEAVELVI
jgi:hypothetical protein